jgi:activator of HSP90 ATPase
MAKWGEGDPRWIVEERPDATNVNNWHWTEKNATPWSKQRLRELLEGLEVETDVASCAIKEMKSCSGEATANNRKAKLIFFYEWVIQCDWTGKLVGSDTEIKGTLEIPNLGDENDSDEVDVNVSTEDSTDEAYTVKEVMRISGSDVIRKALEQYDKELRQEFSQGMILPTGKKAEESVLLSATDIKDYENRLNRGINQNVDKRIDTTSISANAEPGNRIAVIDLHLKSTFKCSPEDLYRAFTIPEMVVAFTNGPVTLDVQLGGRFVMYGGMVEGTFIEVVPNERLKMSWRMKTWPAGHHSAVILTFARGDAATDLTVRQTGVPESQRDAMEQGWERHYFDAVKRTFGFGAYLL